MAQDWYPSRDAARRLFLQNFVANIDKATELMGLPKETFKNATHAVEQELESFGLRDDALKGYDTAQRRLVEQAVLTAAAVRTGVKQIKGTMNLPAQVLDLLELNTVVTDPSTHVGAEAPVLKVKMDGIHPSIGCIKSGFDAVELWSQRGEEKEFTRLATVTHLPYFDNRPNTTTAQAEQRNYHAYFMKKNAVASSQSATAQLLVPGGAHA